MRITFVLPMFLPTPAGGFKVVYEYANHLQARGHEVTVVHPRNITYQKGFKQRVKSYLWSHKLRWQYQPLIQWFPLSNQVKVMLVSDLREHNLPSSDIILATAFQTAFSVSEYGLAKGRKYYLIQHFEDWIGEVDQVRASWRLPLHKVVISKWLFDLAKEFGEAENTSYIPNGLNHAEFYVTRPIEARCDAHVTMMTHSLAFKGTEDGIEALKRVREKIPQIRVTLFGVEARTEAIPFWCEYHQLPSSEKLRELYNEASVFLSPSISEGWGLPAMEAMACGCAVVATENQGIRDFASSGVNALLTPIKRPDLLAEKVCMLLTDYNLRVKLAKAAVISVNKFTWDRAVKSFEQLFSQPPGLPVIPVLDK